MKCLVKKTRESEPLQAGLLIDYACSLELDGAGLVVGISPDRSQLDREPHNLGVPISACTGLPHHQGNNAFGSGTQGRQSDRVCPETKTQRCYGRGEHEKLTQNFADKQLRMTSALGTGNYYAS